MTTPVSLIILNIMKTNSAINKRNIQTGSVSGYGVETIYKSWILNGEIKTKSYYNNLNARSTIVLVYVTMLYTRQLSIGYAKRDHYMMALVYSVQYISAFQSPPQIKSHTGESFKYGETKEHR